MKNNWSTTFSKFMLFSVISITLITTMGNGVSVANAKSATGVSHANRFENQVHNDYVEMKTLSSSTATLAGWQSCVGPTIYLTGVTTLPYNNDSVANGTTFDRTTWYSDAVGNGTSTAFTVGRYGPIPQDVCVLRGVDNGHVPLSWTWQDVHDFGGAGDKIYTGRLASVDGARIHNVEDGWKPRELPEFGNTGIMQMRNTYMSGIRDDAIENDDFMAGMIEDSLFDGVFTFLSEQNQSGTTPTTIGPNEDQYIRLNQVYVRLSPTNSDGFTLHAPRWFKWVPKGSINHKLIISDSVFAVGPEEARWSSLDFPPGTTFQGTNYILWLGTPGVYEGIIPPGVIFLDGQIALEKWSQVRNTWLITHGYDPRPTNDLYPMDDPVEAPVITAISGNTGAAGVTLNYVDVTKKTAISRADGSYSFPVSPGWTGTVTPSSICYTFTPSSRSYSNVTTKQTGQNYTATFNSASGCTDIGVRVQGVDQGRFGLLPGTSTRPNFDSLNSGPVRILSKDDHSLVASQRVLFAGKSYSEMMGLPKEQLTKEYWFPYYNSVAMDSQLRVSNLGDVPTTISVYLGNEQIDSYTLAAGGATRKRYTGLNSGPLKVTSSDTNILSTIRVLFGGVSYSELMGLPKEQLTNEYLFPYYNNVAMDSQLRVSNLGDVPTTITVYLGTQQIDSYTLSPGSASRKNYVGENSGPLRVASSDTNILSTIRVLYEGNSYSELMGYPVNELAQEYWYPAYNDNALDSQLRVSNVGNGDTTIKVYAGGTQIDSYTLGPGGATRKNYSQNTGPLQVVSSSEPILSTIRMLYATPGYASYYEMMGLPDTQLSAQYYFPWYNNIAMNSELRFAVP